MMTKSTVLAFTVRQCTVCHKILRWPVLDMADEFAFQYLHCEKPTEFLEIVSTHEDVGRGVL